MRSAGKPARAMRLTVCLLALGVLWLTMLAGCAAPNPDSGNRVASRYDWSGAEDLMIPNERYENLIPQGLPYPVIGVGYHAAEVELGDEAHVDVDRLTRLLDEEIARLLSTVP